jgi:signal transduction histidine kinase
LDLSPSTASQGEHVEAVGSQTSERRGLEQELAEAQARVSRLESTLVEQARARADLVHLVSHELRTPITIISGFARLLLNESQGSLASEQQRYVEQSLKACRKLDRFVDDLLEASPASGTPLAIEPGEAELHETIESLLESLEPVLEEREQRVEALLDPLPRLVFDAGRIEQVLTNLLSNAVRYGRDGGTIRIRARCAPDERGEPGVEVAVEDDGPGIPEADRERLFEPYVRGEESNRCAGLGIGLAICRRIVDAHGGSIRVEASDLGGARFVFTLPHGAALAVEA